MYTEDAFLMISGIQHFKFCKRQWSLIHIEQQWANNLRTVEGIILHEKAHDKYLSERRGNVIITRGMPVASRKMGISGECDIVEFYEDAQGFSLVGRIGKYQVYPVEYKKGQPKEENYDILQLTAQAICLEEMLCCKVDTGAIYYGETHRRLKVEFTKDLRDEVIEIVAQMHQYFDKRYTIKPKRTKACNSCSLKNICLPVLEKRNSVRNYINNALREDDY